ncbi:hypothetical protein GLAREA_09449 [Glarea lozoyensis ATCC 20868]|uniref:Uncharacterized protein n=1 Tax=Glarea lozoyensis (strain ATCC 20868 / MF5171) TaxID=1116229 RepID=S3CTI1_GLAL2|nr:uncharacterized protein GLAREA_09449 [Glarea lozoyensis ATCC 20868]EPE28329.1 hypothetical protein GLAREA_09449 [Glarea lozoyensis ATCC 20868]
MSNNTSQSPQRPNSPSACLDITDVINYQLASATKVVDKSGKLFEDWTAENDWMKDIAYEMLQAELEHAHAMLKSQVQAFLEMGGKVDEKITVVCGRLAASRDLYELQKIRMGMKTSLERMENS